MTPFEQILPHVPPLLMVIFRLAGLTLFAPVFGSPVIPRLIKVLLVVLIGLAVYPLLAANVFEPIPMRFDLWSLAPLLAMEMLIGAVIGFLAGIPLLAAQTGGLIMGQQMGLGFARFFNPAVDDEADVVGQMFVLMTLAGFLMIGGHEALVLSILHSFSHIPIGAMSPDLDLVALLCAVMNAAFELAMRVSAPLLALIFLETVAMGFIAKTVPQLNILSLGFPLRIIVGIAVVGISLVIVNELLMEHVHDVMSAILFWIEGT